VYLSVRESFKNITCFYVSKAMLFTENYRIIRSFDIARRNIIMFLNNFLYQIFVLFILFTLKFIRLKFRIFREYTM